MLTETACGGKPYFYRERVSFFPVRAGAQGSLCVHPSGFQGAGLMFNGSADYGCTKIGFFESRIDKKPAFENPSEFQVQNGRAK